MIQFDKKKQLALLFFEAGSLQVNTESQFTLTSGKKSPLYFDHRLLMSTPKTRKLLIDIWSEEILNLLKKEVTKYFKKTDQNSDFKYFISEHLMIAGTASAGIAPALLLSEALNCQFAYVRTSPKQHGLGRQWEGKQPSRNQMVLLIDDMITSGKSVSQAGECVKQICTNVDSNFLGVSCITTHSLSQKLVSKLIPNGFFHSCYTSLSLVNIALELKILTLSQAETCKNWILAQL
jgi:orotate phosphoribosyltransferase